MASTEIPVFINVWKELAAKEGLPGFYFIGQDNDCRNMDKILSLGFDAVYDDNTFNIHHHMNLLTKGALFVARRFFKIPTVFSYKNAIKYMITKNSIKDDVIPVIVPNWDHSPRSGRKGIILGKSNPSYFKKLVSNALLSTENKSPEKQIIIKKNQFNKRI